MSLLTSNDSSEHAFGDDEWNFTVPPLSPIPSTLAKPGDKLCDVCKAFELTPSRFVILPSENIQGLIPGDRDLHLGRIKDMRKKPYCPLCRLTLTLLGGKAFPAVKDGNHVKVGMGWITAGPSPGAYPVRSFTPVVRTLRLYAFTGKKKNKEPVHGPVPFFPQIVMFANDAPTPSKLCLRRIIEDQIDFRIVRNALALCKKWHASACDKSKRFCAQFEDPAEDIPHFRLIDTKDNRIVLPPKGSTYVTLSYVWGRIDPETILRLVRANVEQLANPGSLLLPENHDRIPVTVRDAMEVVRRLNLRYLWVDSLCIVQDDNGPGGSKMSAISKMDLVYGGSYVTIVAAAGIDATAGLLGVRPGTRGTTRIIEELYPGLRLGSQGIMGSDAEKNIYFERGWTFQEQQLASRRLVFQRDRVVFICQKNYGGWSEDVVFEDTMEGIPGDSHDNEDNKAGDNHDGDEDSSDEDGSDEDDSDEDENDSDETRNNDDVTVNVDRSNINDYTDLIMNYSGLSLSYESDRYHAFAGMNRYFKEELLADLCHGIPDSLFDWFLVWVPSSGVLARRDTCPSWSWSGWNGSISVRVMHTFQHKISVIRQQIRRRTWIIWYQRKAHDSEECLLVWSPLQESHDLSPTNFYGGPIQSHFSFDCTQTVPTRRTLDNAPTYLEDSHSPSPGSGFLQFWTVSVYFKLEISANVSYERGTQGHKRVGIFGRDGRELSSILIDPKWAEANVPRIHEFILLCEGQDKPFSFAGRTGWSYIIMLLEWRGDWAERVSLGIIRKDDLFQALGQGPVWKEIILG